MSKLLVCSEPDLPSVNMREQLFKEGGWEEAGSEEDCNFLTKGDLCMMSTSNLHIKFDSPDKIAEKAGFKVDSVIFMSKHSAASGEPALTVHPIGNYHDNDLGGRAGTLVPPCPPMMTDALRNIARYNDMEEFRVCFEVTHHGPWLDKPTMFIEIGSDERNWGNVHAAEIQAKVIDNLSMNGEEYPTVIGIAGGHYAPRFTELALSYKVNMGHMIPNYQLEGRDDEDILRMVKHATDATGTKMVYMHRNALKKSVQRHVIELIEGAGYEHVRSADLEPLNGN